MATKTSAPASGKPAAKKPKPKPKTPQEGLSYVEKGELTFAEAMGLTRTEAYGIAFSAHRLFEHGQVARAKGILEGLIIVNPKDAYFPCLLGAIYGREKNEDEALRLYNISIKLDPKNLTARASIAPTCCCVEETWRRPSTTSSPPPSSTPKRRRRSASAPLRLLERRLRH